MALPHGRFAGEIPTGSIEIDRQSPFAQGLVFCAPMLPATGMRDLVQGQQPTLTGLTGRTPAANGSYPLFGGSNYADYPVLPLGITGSTPVTIGWTQRPAGTSSYSTVLNIKFTGSSAQFVIYESNQASYHFVAGNRGAGGDVLPSFDAVVGAATDGVLDRYLLQLLAGPDSNTASNSILWRNCVRLTTSSTIAFSGGSSAVFRAGALDSAGDPFEGGLGNLHMWLGILPDPLAFRWTSPGGEFSALKWKRRRLWAPSSAAGSSTITTAILAAGVGAMGSGQTRAILPAGVGAMG